MLFRNGLFRQTSDEVLISWSTLFIFFFHRLRLSHPLLYHLSEVHEVHTLPMTLIRKASTWSEILLIVLAEFRGVEKTRISHVYKRVILEHRAEIKGLWKTLIERWTFKLLLKLWAKYSIEIFKVVVLIMTKVDVIIEMLPILSIHKWSVMLIWASLMVHRIHLVAQIDS